MIRSPIIAPMTVNIMAAPMTTAKRIMNGDAGKTTVAVPSPTTPPRVSNDPRRTVISPPTMRTYFRSNLLNFISVSSFAVGSPPPLANGDLISWECAFSAGSDSVPLILEYGPCRRHYAVGVKCNKCVTDWRFSPWRTATPASALDPPASPLSASPQRNTKRRKNPPLLGAAQKDGSIMWLLGHRCQGGGNGGPGMPKHDLSSPFLQLLRCLLLDPGLTGRDESCCCEGRPSAVAGGRCSPSLFRCRRVDGRLVPGTDVPDCRL